jgi:uncharacterized RDD family membrane protein YckC
MKYIYSRVVAYLIDMLLVVVAATFLSRVSFLNPDLNNYLKYSKLYSEHNLNYQSYVSELQKYYSNGKLSEKEINKLVDKYGDIANPLVTYGTDINKKQYDKVLKDANDDFMKQNKKLYYKVTKYSLAYNIILVVLLVLYFVVFNVVTDGQTLGKRLLNLKIVSAKGGSVKWYNYVIRCLILYGPLYYVCLIFGFRFMGVNSFYNFALVIDNIKNYLTVIVFVFIMFRKDYRGLHDILANTMVIDTKTIKSEEVEAEVVKETPQKKRKTNKKIVVEDKEN